MCIHAYKTSFAYAETVWAHLAAHVAPDLPFAVRHLEHRVGACFLPERIEIIAQCLGRAHLDAFIAAVARVACQFLIRYQVRIGEDGT
jgi:ABC-type Fe3+ transport system permease subunit